MSMSLEANTKVLTTCLKLGILVLKANNLQKAFLLLLNGVHSIHKAFPENKHGKI